MTDATAASDNKVIIVTGASSGIGWATARRLAAAGHVVAVGARRRDRLVELQQRIRDDGGECHQLALDVTDPESFAAFVGETVEHLGRVDVLVNNAGVMPLAPIGELHTEEWDRMIDVNIRGVLHGIAAVLPTMQEQGSGQIVNVASIAAFGVFPTATVYCATKYAVRAITEGLRQELDGIRTTLVSPGAVESELTSTITHAPSLEAVDRMREIALPAEAIASAIGYAVDLPYDVDLNEVLVRPTGGM